MFNESHLLGTIDRTDSSRTRRVGAFHTRPAEEVDASILSVIEREAFPAQWPPTRFTNEISRRRAVYMVATRDYMEPEIPEALRDQRRLAHSSMWNRVSSGLRQFLLLDESKSAGFPKDYIVGFVGVWFIVDEAHIVSIGVRESVKRVGVGELLLLSAFQQARKHGCKELTLEVRASNNAAQSLYRKYGFQSVGLRKKYYIDNAEDAIIMTTPPISSVEYAVMLDSLARNHAERWGHLPEPIA
ncbi:MAG: ribosomal protein S18-alanine N-acetyltransferase [Chloroflexi bacterium]|nr:ribosomal protein S18-alanine N-acetyltransferase [Chloroflexota bacterium]